MFGLSKEEKLQKYLNNRMPGHNFRITGKLEKGFHWDCDALPSQRQIIEQMIDRWIDDNRWETVPKW